MIHLSILFLLLSFPKFLSTTTFTLTNNCPFPIWPAALSNSGSPALPSSSFHLPPNSSLSLQSPPAWSGRFWARTACAPNSSCLTGDTPPATLAEFSLASPDQSKFDFYDVSLVDGYNLPISVQGGNGRCAPTGCFLDLNQRCPAELRVGEGKKTVACRSACGGFRRPEFCCSGEFGSAATCKPNKYSELFKEVCPKSYSYAFDDASSTFTCVDAGEFTVTFCPGEQSQKSPNDRSITPKASPTSPKAPEGGGLMLEDDAWFSSFVDGSAESHILEINSSSLMLVVVLCSISMLFILSSSIYY